MAVRVRELYARALFDAAASDEERRRFLTELRDLNALFGENPDYLRLMISPSLEKAKRRELLGEAFAGEVHPKVLNLMKVLTDNGRFREFSAITEEYGLLLDEYDGVLAVTAITAAPLSAELAGRIREKLAAETGKTVRLETRVDRSVLGGVLLRYEGREIDGTVRAKLDGMRARIVNTAVN